MVLVGCSNTLERQTIKVEKRVGDDYNYQEYRKVTTLDQVKKVKEILDDIDWEHAKVDMERPADYRFSFQHSNDSRAVLYELWIGPTNLIELIIDASEKYAQLDREKSAILFEIITGEKLPDRK